MKKAIILCSGGLDSATVAFYVKRKKKYGEIEILFFNYRQRNLSMERIAARWCAKQIDAEYKEINIDWLGKVSDSLLNRNKSSRDVDGFGLKNTKKESDSWYVPARNLIFVSAALAHAEKEGADIYLGFKNDGRETFPDASAGFLKAIQNVSNISVKNKPKIIAPFAKKDKEDIIKTGKRLGIEYSKTYSCYIGKKKHCGKCLACRLRKAGFYWSGINDSTEYSDSNRITN